MKPSLPAVMIKTSRTKSILTWNKLEIGAVEIGAGQINYLPPFFPMPW